ncbi:MAG: hypothetical protein ACE5JD_10605 [Candidatus Methylomirabilia bacterium]
MTRRLGVLFLAFAVLAGGLLLLVPSAWAVPAFARTYGLKCSACHTAWPALNATGRRFKETGYMFRRGAPKEMKKISGLSIPVTYPLATVVKLRPYDKKREGDTKLRALHEVEVFFAGNAWDLGSFFTELELEDETGFEVELGHAVAGFHPHPLVNLVMGKGTVFHADAHDTLTNDRKLTRSSRQPLNQGASTGVKLKNAIQMVSLYGRETLANKLFYSVTYSADASDNEGAGPKDWTGRLVLDILPDLSLGGFITDGEQGMTSGGVTRDLDFTRYGFDLQARFQDLSFLGAWVRAEDDIFAGRDEENNFSYLEAFYTVPEKVLKSMGVPGVRVVPLTRLDLYEKSDGRDDFADLTFNLGYYPWDNVRLYTEYFTSVDRPAGKDKEWRWTVQVEFGF